MRALKSNARPGLGALSMRWNWLKYKAAACPSVPSRTAGSLRRSRRQSRSATLEVPVVYMTSYGRFIAALQPAPTKNVLLRVNQYRLFADPHRALTLAKAAVKAKINNQRTLLMRCLRSRSLDEPVNGTESGKGSDEPAARAMVK